MALSGVYGTRDDLWRDLELHIATVTQHPAFAGKAATGFREEPVAESSFIQKFAYDPGTMQLTVTMKSGAEYVHFQIYPQVFEDFVQAKSKGSYYARVIKAQGNASRIIDKNIGRTGVQAPTTRTVPTKNGRTHGR